MNKKLKIATVAVSAVMAGTLAFGMFGCQTTRDPSDTTNSAIKGGAWDATPSEGATNFSNKLKTTYHLNERLAANAAAWNTANQYWSWIKDTVAAPSEDGANLAYEANTTIGIGIGYDGAATGAFYKGITGNVELPGGYTATTGVAKPAFQAIESALNIKFENHYNDTKTGATLKDLMDTSHWGVDTFVAVSDLSKVVESASNNDNILNLGEYLDQMPNFKAFLEENPIVYLSLLQDGMKQNGDGKLLYVAPYFDGNDDIERYCLIRQDWVVDLLDKELTHDGDAYNVACSEEAYVKGYMGTTGKVEIDTTKDATGATFKLKKDYDAALAAAKNETSELGSAYKAIANEVYVGESGNIVDIMDAALEKNNEATGKQLATLYRAYIDVAYKNASDGDKKAYETRSEVFNGYNAAWDVDDLVAMLRIVKTNSENLGLAANTTTGIFARSAQNDRTPDIIRLLSQLYGERGADSRYEYTYLDSNGNLQDMRGNASFYQALENFGLFAKENLVAKYIGDNAVGSVDAATLKGDCKTKPGTGFMIYDYSQTQTTQMFDVQSTDDYLFGAISTPVSRWDDNGDGVKDTIMRFTESWRSTKTTGLCVAANVKNNTDKLNAVLTFIDYLYSNDGQIISTYGPQSTNGNTNPNGFWYGNEVTNVDINTVATKVGGQYVVKEEYESQYFAFNGALYTGTLYKGKMTPTVTDELKTSFLSQSGGVFNTFGARGNFTGYARKVIGSTLPMGVKDQSFENQLTAERASAAATKVSVSLSNGTIKHPELNLTTNLWYTVVPTGLPLNDDQTSILGAPNQSDLRFMTGEAADGSNKNIYSIFHHIIFNGYTGQYQMNTVTITLP